MQSQRDLVFDNAGRFTLPWDVHNHLHIGNVGECIERNILNGPDASQDEQDCAGENKKTVSSAPFDYAGNHGYIPPSAIKVSCLEAMGWPFFVAVKVICHVPPLSNLVWPS
jgi:hypothetical protein